MSGTGSTPETVEVPGLGTFEHRPEFNSAMCLSWIAQVKWNGLAVTVSYEEDGITVLPADLMAAGGRVLAFLEREEAARREVATTMLDLAEDWWAARDDVESETPLTVEKFMGLMHLDTIVIEDDGGLTVYFDDNEEVFAGHTIQVRFDASGSLIDTDIPG